jgi:hypothetical protein
MGGKMFLRDYMSLYGAGASDSKGYVKMCEAAGGFKRREQRTEGESGSRTKGVSEFREGYRNGLIPSEPTTSRTLHMRGRGKQGGTNKILRELLRSFCRKLYEFVSKAQMFPLAGECGGLLELRG